MVSFVKKCKKVFTNEGDKRIIQDVTSQTQVKTSQKEDNMKHKMTEGGTGE
jgi:hypothetical protein